MRKRKYRRKHNYNFLILTIFSITFLFIGLAYANTNYLVKTTGIARIGSQDNNFTLTLSHSILDMGIGESANLVATVNPGTGSESITWSSSNAKVATVDSDGNVTAISAGNATIVAEYNGVKVTCIVTVTADTYIDYSQYLTVTIDHGNNYYNNIIWWATVTITNTSGINFETWSCELQFPSIATFGFEQNDFGVKIEGNTLSGTNLSGSITLHGKIEILLGYQIINYLPVKLKNVNVTFASEDVEATAIELSQSSVTVLEGEAQSVFASITPINATGTVSWVSSDESIATVKNGLIRGVKEGETTVIAKIGNVSSTCKVQVQKAVELESIILSENAIDIEVGESKILTATKNPKDSYGVISWISSDENIVTIDTNGKIQAKSIGTATITAKCGNISSNCSVTVFEKNYDGWITASIFFSNPDTTNNMYGGLTFKNTTNYDFSSWSATVEWPDGTSTSVNCYANNSLNSTDCIINGNTYSGNFFIYGTTIEFWGFFTLPDGYTWQDFPEGEVKLKDIKVEYEE